MKDDDISLTDIKLSHEDYWYTSAPTDNEKPFIRPVKIGSNRYLYFYDVDSETWHSIQMT